MISVVIPIHDMKNGAGFLWRAIRSVTAQTYRNYEIVITERGEMAHNTNAGIRKAKGDIVKILFMDDYLTGEDTLQTIADRFTGGWLVTGCAHDDGHTSDLNPHVPSYNDEIHTGKNTIGSPSVLAFENKEPLLFDEYMTWLLDCDLYKRLYGRYGPPTIVDEPLVTIGIGEHQMTNTISPGTKLEEANYLKKKYEK